VHGEVERYPIYHAARGILPRRLDDSHTLNTREQRCRVKFIVLLEQKMEHLLLYFTYDELKLPTLTNKFLLF
jgi:hypothetical protein